MDNIVETLWKGAEIYARLLFSFVKSPKDKRIFMDDYISITKGMIVFHVHGGPDSAASGFTTTM
jgi:hypothetical protein